MTCPRCGHHAGAGDRFCDNCGLELGSAADVEDRVVIEVVPERVAVAAGSEATAEVAVRNVGTVVEHVQLAVGGTAAAWVTADPTSLRIMPGTSAAAVLHLRPPRAATTPAGAHALIVEARSTDRAASADTAHAIVDVTPFDLVAMRVVPRTATRWRGSERRLELTNSGNSPALVDVNAVDDDDLMRFPRLPQQAAVPAGGSEILRFRARAKRTRLFGGKPVPRDFTVTARTREGLDVTAAGVLRQRAVITVVTVLLALILLLVLVLIVVGVQQ
jgi:hypothetical protein